VSAALRLVEPVPPPAKPVGAVAAALKILRCLGAAAEAPRLSDIVSETGLNSSTALNILRTLEFEGLVAFDRRSKRYVLAEGLVDLAAPLLERADPARRFSRAMDAAAHELGATVALWRHVGEEVELVQVAESSAVMRIAFTVGRRLPMFLGAMGRLVAARGAWSAEALRQGFERVHWTRAPDYADWLAEVAAARRDGVACDPGNVNHGVLGVAVPVEVDGRLDHIVAAALFETEQTPATPTIIERLRGVAALHA
jgi:DNA-binding IclR family transcriptional regulator